MKERILKAFDSMFEESAEPKRTFFSPGRVNLIGEHLDYNGGHVLPCAIDLGNWLVFRPRRDSLIKVYSDNFAADGILTLEREGSHSSSRPAWTDYLKGALIELNYDLPVGFDLYIRGDLPAGAGLSSSASICAGLVYGISALMARPLGQKQMALISQRIEHRHIGVNCGIMDQYVILFGEKDKAIYLDTASLTHEAVDFTLDGLDLVISNTNKKRSLRTSEYNDRRSACDRASRLLGIPVAQAGPDEVKDLDLDPITLDRAIYVSQEEARVRQAVSALHQGDLVLFGELMNQSHYGLRDQFNVSSPELDFLSLALREGGALGSRMTGAGFGGCTVSLIPQDRSQALLEKVSAQYEKAFGLTPSHYLVRPSAGTREI